MTPYITYGIEGKPQKEYKLLVVSKGKSSSSFWWDNGYGVAGKLVIKFYTEEGILMDTITVQITD